MEFLLLKAFRAAFEGHPYYHRDSSIGDRVAVWLFEDLAKLAKSKVLKRRLASGEVVVSVSNVRVGILARRGDGSLGELVPGTDTKSDPGYVVPRGQVATVEIGIEVKILAKSMIKQIDRVMNDLERQVRQFKKGGGRVISVGIVGINEARQYHSFEGKREYDTAGTSKDPHPFQQAAEAKQRLEQESRQHFDEFLILPFRAENVPPYEFAWVDEKQTSREYGALLTRVCRKYDEYFG